MSTSALGPLRYLSKQHQSNWTIKFFFISQFILLELVIRVSSMLSDPSSLHSCPYQFPDLRREDFVFHFFFCSGRRWIGYLAVLGLFPKLLDYFIPLQTWSSRYVCWLVFLNRYICIQQNTNLFYLSEKQARHLIVLRSNIVYFVRKKIFV